MLFMVIEQFNNADPRPIYQHLRDHGRGLPEGVRYIDSWIEPSFNRCFQLMECEQIELLQQWVLHWVGMARFEIVPVVSAATTRVIVEAGLHTDGS